MRDVPPDAGFIDQLRDTVREDAFWSSPGSKTTRNALLCRATRAAKETAKPITLGGFDASKDLSAMAQSLSGPGHVPRCEWLMEEGQNRWTGTGYSWSVLKLLGRPQGQHENDPVESPAGRLFLEFLDLFFDILLPLGMANDQLRKAARSRLRPLFIPKKGLGDVLDDCCFNGNGGSDIAAAVEPMLGSRAELTWVVNEPLEAMESLEARDQEEGRNRIERGFAGAMLRKLAELERRPNLPERYVEAIAEVRRHVLAVCPKATGDALERKPDVMPFDSDVLQQRGRIAYQAPPSPEEEATSLVRSEALELLHACGWRPGASDFIAPALHAIAAQRLQLEQRRRRMKLGAADPPQLSAVEQAAVVVLETHDHFDPATTHWDEFVRAEVTRLRVLPEGQWLAAVDPADVYDVTVKALQDAVITRLGRGGGNRAQVDPQPVDDERDEVSTDDSER